MSKILFIDDDKNLCNLIKRSFERGGDYVVSYAYNGEDALKEVSNFGPDIIITDLDMPGIGGNEFIKRIRAAHNNIGIIVLTGKVQYAEACGADVFLNKPFKRSVVEINIKNLIKLKGLATSGNIYHIGMYSFKSRENVLILNNKSYEAEEQKKISLTLMQSKLLEMLCRKPNKCISRDEVLNTLWYGYDRNASSHTLNVLISSLNHVFPNNSSLKVVSKNGVNVCLII